MKKTLVVLLGLAAAVYALLCAWVYARQRALIYYPVPERVSAVGESITLPVEGAVLKVWTVKRPGSRALIYADSTFKPPAQPQFARVFA